MLKVVITVFFCAFLVAGIRSQTIDTTKIIQLNDSVVPHHDKKKLYSKPRTATILSICLPGLGQAYNKKFWKIPIVYAGLGGFAYMYYFNNYNYNYYSQNLRYESDDDPETINTSGYSESQLQELKATPRKRRDFAMIGIGAMYILNIIDANVDAHLKTFDVSDDLSISVDPWQSMNTGLQTKQKIITGISIKINFK